MDKTYQPDSIEQRWYNYWEEKGFFEPSPERSSENQPFCIMLPPPNVTGTLHMGHAFQHTLMDLLTRYHKMSGDSSLWQPGQDHAGIATQMLVERQVNAQGQTRHDLGREAFLKRVWEWKEQSGGTITRQMRRLGTACDWSRERFTMDEGLSDAVREVFVKLYDDGLIYRGKRLVNWDPVLHTALSDLEVLSAEEKGYMWHFRYPLADEQGRATSEYLIVATTRPETLLGDTAVAVHPDDERYQHLVGKQVLLPLANRLIPVVADEYADPEKGTGCVKITPAHDFNDYQVGKRHELPMINVLTIHAALNEEAPEKYRGLDRYEARKQIVADMNMLGFLEEIKDHVLMVPRGDRSGAVVEPYLTDQWYVDLTTEQQADGRPGGKTLLTDPAIEVVESGKVRFVPGNWDKTYYQWMNNLEDWCISRQLWWGHRIPAWYDENNQVYVGYSEQDVRKKHQLGGDIVLRQDEDVLDTWFSSALWPFSTLGWPEANDALEKWYPTSVLVTGFDIIFFWVARMILFGNYCMKDIPFQDVYVHGLVRDADGMKMSKSKGNTLDPLDIIDGISLEQLLEKRTSGLMQPHLAEKIAKATKRQYPDGIPSYGTDALRFTFTALASTGRDVRLDLNRIEGYRNFCNKLWNAARFVMMQCEGQDTGLDTQQPRTLSWADQWILQEQQNTTKQVSEYIEQYRFDLAANTLYEFIWHEYCDWYLEFTKPILSSENADEAAQRGTRHTLVQVLETTLRLIHPFMPYISEEIWQSLKPLSGKQNDSIMLEAYPTAAGSLPQTAEIQQAIDWLKTFIMNIRRIRSEMEIAPGKQLNILLQGWSDNDQARYQQTAVWIQSLAKVDSIEWLAADAEAPESATALVGDMQILIPLAGLIDKQAEAKRLQKAIEKLEKGLVGLEKRLNNPAFTEKAKPAVVEQARQQQQEQRAALEQLEQQLDKIKAL